MHIFLLQELKDRQQGTWGAAARDESLEKLQKIVDSTKETDKAHIAAADKIASISDIISTENKIETLVKAKGVNNCLAVINEDATKVNVIVDSKDLTDQIILQIKEITVSQLGCSYEDVTIIQSNWINNYFII